MPITSLSKEKQTTVKDFAKFIAASKGFVMVAAREGYEKGTQDAQVVVHGELSIATLRCALAGLETLYREITLSKCSRAKCQDLKKHIVH